MRLDVLKCTPLWLILSLVVSLSPLVSTCSCSSHGGLDGKTKILRKVLGAKGKSLDPHQQFDAESADIVVMLFDSLFSTHYLKRPIEFVPNLAESMPVFSDSGKTMIIKLRKDVKFQDGDCFLNDLGRPFTSADVVYSFTRFADPYVNANSYSLIEGLIVGLDAARRDMETRGEDSYTYDEFPVEGLQALDEHTVQIKLTRATMVPMQVMAKTVMAIVPRECVEKYGQDFQFHPLGTGAFKLKYRNRLGDVWLTKNQNYHLTYPSEGEPGDREKGLLDDVGKQLPLVDEVYAPVIQESQPAVLKFLRGYFDWIGLDADAFQRLAVKTESGEFQVRDEYQEDVSLYAARDSTSYWLAFNLKHPILGKNLKLRQAIAMTINRQGFIDDIINGRGVVLDTVVPLTLSSNHVDLKVEWYKRDVARARQLMIEAGFSGGKGLPEFGYMTTTGGMSQRMFEYHRRTLAEIGVKLKMEAVTYSSYLQKMDSGDFDLLTTGWGADYPDPENFTSLLTTYARTQGQNYGSWSNERYDFLSDQTKLVPPGQKRDELFREMALLVKQDVPIVPLYSVIRVGLYPKNWVRNFKRDLESGRDALHIDIDVKRQKEGFSL
jgi:oligopeptide transport system substrate-binding protein